MFQMLDGLEVMERKRAHEMLFAHLAPYADQPSYKTSLRVSIIICVCRLKRKKAESNPSFANLRFTARVLASNAVCSHRGFRPVSDVLILEGNRLNGFPNPSAIDPGPKPGVNETAIDDNATIRQKAAWTSIPF